MREATPPSPTPGQSTPGPRQDLDPTAAQTLAPVEIPPHLQGKLDPKLPPDVIAAILKTDHANQGKNRGGRTKRPNELRDLARQFCPEAIGKLVHLMRNAKDQKVQKMAATDLLDRGYGKAVIADKLPEDKDEKGEQLPDDELDSILDA